MVEVNIRNKNSIVNLIVVGKVAIRGKTAANLYFHTPLELLLSSLGLCIGGKINDYCRLNDLNPAIFEQISLNYDGSNFIVYIKHPEDLDKEHIERIHNEITYCTIAQELKKEVKVKFSLNTIPKEELLKVVEQPCCGAK